MQCTKPTTCATAERPGSHAPPAPIGSPEKREGSHMRRREFIAGLGAAAWPVVAGAQQSASPIIGYLDYFGPRPKSPQVEAFRAGLADGGFIEGVNLSIEYRWAGGNSRRLADLVADLVSRQVALIVAVGAVSPALVAKA